ncbi:uncharacterized protein LOC122301628 [Carya illinoinensis]|uniref:uncharacterized protein LOC122301628 n=1 Tax=Carya illinoinensis TaxID=32201 RepID=UPI001C725FE3|nr:uncharacterized protein LOC122301628 [Carya illinoinensis]
MVIGAFNELLHHNEKWGGRPWPFWQISAFRDVVNNCSSKDMGFKGNKFPWSNRRGGAMCISERLDRVLANQPWLGFFPNASVTHGLEAYSDHTPIWVNTEWERGHIRVGRQFKFEEMWVGEPECEEIITASWRRD